MMPTCEDKLGKPTRSKPCQSTVHSQLVYPNLHPPSHGQMQTATSLLGYKAVWGVLSTGKKGEEIAMNEWMNESNEKKRTGGRVQKLFSHCSSLTSFFMPVIKCQVGLIPPCLQSLIQQPGFQGFYELYCTLHSGPDAFMASLIGVDLRLIVGPGFNRRRRIYFHRFM
jgi:hypothetical protein